MVFRGVPTEWDQLVFSRLRERDNFTCEWRISTIVGMHSQCFRLVTAMNEAEIRNRCLLRRAENVSNDPLQLSGGYNCNVPLSRSTRFYGRLTGDSWI